MTTKLKIYCLLYWISPTCVILVMWLEMIIMITSLSCWLMKNSHLSNFDYNIKKIIKIILPLLTQSVTETEWNSMPLFFIKLLCYYCSVYNCTVFCWLNAWSKPYIIQQTHLCTWTKLIITWWVLWDLWHQIHT